MRILTASMPLLALVAIFSASAMKRIDHAAMVAARMDDKALPGCVEILDRVQYKKDQGFYRSSHQIAD